MSKVDNRRAKPSGTWYASDKASFHNRLAELEAMRDPQVLHNTAMRDRMDKVEAVIGRVSAVASEAESHWRVSAKTSMQRQQDVRVLQTAVQDANERICKLEQRLLIEEAARKRLEAQVGTHRSLLCRLTEPTITPPVAAVATRYCSHCGHKLEG